MSDITWEVPVAVDLFFAGVGAGSFCLAAIAAKRKGTGWEACSRMSSILAPLSVAFGLGMLVLDLRNKARFWMTLRVLNVDSPMSIGVWLLSSFFLVSFLFALCKLPFSARQRIPWIGKLLSRSMPGLERSLGIAGILLALGVSVYTGVLLSVSIVPLWRDWSLPLLFFLSAMATGFAGGSILAMLSLRKENPDAMKEPLHFVRRSYRVILPLYLLTMLAYLCSQVVSPASRTNVVSLITGWNGLIWWAGVMGMGILVPLFLVMKADGIRARHHWILFGFVLTGGFLLRAVLIMAGQKGM